jgi:hypothetical protein
MSEQRINFGNPFRNFGNLFRKKRKKSGITETVYGAGGLQWDTLPTETTNYSANNNYGTGSSGSKSVDGNAIMGQLGKLYQEYGPSLQYLQKNPGMRGGVEAGLDYGMRSLPGVGPVYGGIQDFNRATGGGINVGKAFGLKQDPFKALGSRIFGDPNKNPMTPAEMAILGRNASRMSGLENAANSDIASSRIEREKLGGQQRNVLDLLTDMTLNPQSSRDLASTVGAGVAPLQELASKRMSDSRANIAQRGLSGGMATGMIEGSRQASDAGIADIYNRTTLEAMSRRPQIASMLAGVIGQEQSRLDARDNAARGMIGQIDQQEFARSMSEQQLALDRDRLAAAERASNLQGLGALAGQFGPDLIAELKRLRNKPSNPEEFIGSVPTLATAANRPIQPRDDLEYRPISDIESDFSTYEPQRPGDYSVTDGGDNSQIQMPQYTPEGRLDQSAAGTPVAQTTAWKLEFQYPGATPGFITPPVGNGVTYMLTPTGWRRMESKKAINNFGAFRTTF